MKEGKLSALRKHRYNIAGARYFITCVTEGRKGGLNEPAVWACIRKAIEETGYDFLALVAMPEHVHALFRLSTDERVGEVVRALKGPITPILRARGLRWQKNFFEHRLRAEESIEPYLVYMLCNPYRKKLLGFDERWPYWWLVSPEFDWFEDKFPSQIPEPEWLRISEPWLDDE